MTARQIPAIAPGSAEWLRYMSASKISAVLGLSPWESPYSLWCQMAGLVQRDEQTKAQARGHYLETSIANWMRDQHPEYELAPGGCWINEDRPWQLASPDGRFLADGRLVDLAEYKTDADGSGWGEPGTDEVPLYYRAQALWQMDTLGVSQVRFGVLTGRLEFREYVVDYDADDVRIMRERAEDFLDSLLWQEMPDLDAHPATYEAVRFLHPDIADKKDPLADVAVDDDLAAEFLTALAEADAASERMQAARTRLLGAMGSARRARWNGYTLATRQAKGGGTPYLVAGRNLPAAPAADMTFSDIALNGVAA
ncbi:lambda-exonuclease family protein [Streptosporangium sp. DT93]|uniref:lambda-exonuclease family protein n=1 Tax=Streptosporangium sp. DT93 TaxID=3393428 RepID=UPI003CF3A701